MNWLLARALFAFLVLPGMFGFAIPLLLVEPEWRARPFHPGALMPLVFGISLLLACVREFYISGKGTLAPWSPPIHLVTTGPYRFSRNPMYVAVSITLIGWALAFESTRLAWYAIFMMLLFYLRVLFGEEPRLARAFGDEWRSYQARTGRWIGRRDE